MKKQEYDNNTMKMLKGADRVRLRPSVIFGSDDITGVKQSLFEILSNSIDEGKEGHGELIIMTKHKDLSWTIEDYGRGLPLDWNEKQGYYNYHIALCELYGGGKYEGVYSEGALGTNGLGLSSTQMASEFMEVTSYRDGYKYFIRCEKGEPIMELEKKEFNEERTGTIINYKPDLEVFTEIDIPMDWVEDMVEKQSIITPHVKFILINEITDKTLEFHYKNGIVEYLEEKIEKPLHDVILFEGNGIGQDTPERPEYKFNYSFAFCFTGNENIQMVFHNNGNLIHGGSTLNAIKSALTYSIDKIIKDNNKYLKKDKKITTDDIFDGLSFISNSYSTITSYSNQTKTSINNRFIQEFLNKNLRHQLEVYFIENPFVAQKVINQALVNMRSRTTAETTRLDIKKKLSEKPTLTNKVKKFIDCRSKDVDKTELYIVEGDSAAGSCKLGRDANFQAIMPIRGKILNCLKSDMNRILKTEIIIDLFKLFGCGMDVKTKGNKNISLFDLESLKWSKIIICTDADIDGFQIRTLVLAMIYCLAPELIHNGKVYIAETPLYEITINGETFFTYSDEERDELLKKYKGNKNKIDIQRSKGLGENTPDMMWETTMNPETRHLVRVNATDEDTMKEVFDLLLGNNLKDRKEYIETYGKFFVSKID